MNGVWYECPAVKRFALPAVHLHHFPVIVCVNLVSASGTTYLSAKKPAKHIVVQSVTCTLRVDDGGFSK